MNANTKANLDRMEIKCNCSLEIWTDFRWRSRLLKMYLFRTNQDQTNIKQADTSLESFSANMDRGEGGGYYGEG